MIGESTEFGARVARRLRDEHVVWMTTVTGGGAPVPRPVWFLWDGEDTVLVYSTPGLRIRNIEANPHITLNFDGDGAGGDIVVLSGEAVLERDTAPVHEHPEYLAKYEDWITGRLGTTPEAFGRRYSVPVRIRITDVSGQ